MRTKSKYLRSLREEIEALRPQTPEKKWELIFRSIRVAGRPRSVAAAEHVVLLADFAADTGLNKDLRAAARAKKKQFLNCAAFKETLWLDQTQLKKYLSEFRKNGYTGPAGYTWIENREKDP